jgi:hypothetical protein
MIVGSIANRASLRAGKCTSIGAVFSFAICTRMFSVALYFPLLAKITGCSHAVESSPFLDRGGLASHSSVVLPPPDAGTCVG